MRRRELLRFVLLAVGAAMGMAAGPGFARPGRRPDDRRLSPRDASLAGLGARFAATDPDTARALVAEVEAVRREDTHGLADETRRLRRAFLGSASRERDLARGAVLVVDGWLLTRSEVAYCVHLDRQRRPSGRRPRAKLG